MTASGRKPLFPFFRSCRAKSRHPSVSAGPRGISTSLDANGLVSSRVATSRNPTSGIAHRLRHFGDRDEFLAVAGDEREFRSEEHTSELQSLMRISYAVFCLKKKK